MSERMSERDAIHLLFPDEPDEPDEPHVMSERDAIHLLFPDEPEEDVSLIPPLPLPPLPPLPPPPASDDDDDDDVMIIEPDDSEKEEYLTNFRRKRSALREGLFHTLRPESMDMEELDERLSPSRIIKWMRMLNDFVLTLPPYPTPPDSSFNPPSSLFFFDNLDNLSTTEVVKAFHKNVLVMYTSVSLPQLNLKRVSRRTRRLWAASPQDHHYHGILIIIYKREKKVVCFDSARWVRRKSELMRAMLNRSSSSVKRLLTATFADVLVSGDYSGWSVSIPEVIWQSSEAYYPKSCGTFSSWFALWVAFHPGLAFDGIPPPLIGHDVDGFKHFIQISIANGKIEIPDLPIWHDSVGGKKIGKKKMGSMFSFLSKLF